MLSFLRSGTLSMLRIFDSHITYANVVRAEIFYEVIRVKYFTLPNKGPENY